MGMLQLAVGALMTTSHPDIDRRRCWNMRMSKERCTRCVDICPNSEKIWRRPGSPQDWSSCTDCGLCAQLCPVGAIDPSNLRAVNKEACISCMRCIAVCPTKARAVDANVVAAVAQRLEPLLGGHKKNYLYL